MAQVNAGRVRFVSRGEYNNSTQYYLFDLVDYNGSSYFAKANTTGNVPTNTTYWQLVAEKGNTGGDGPVGPTGNGIASVTKTASAGLIDTYTITFTNGSTTTFNVTNGQDGEVTQEYVDEENERLKSVFNVLPKVSDSGESIELENTGDTMLYKMDLKGNTSQEVIQGEVGLEEEDTSIYVDDVNEDKEDYITLKGNTYQETTTGKNLLNCNDFVASTVNGITFTPIFNENGTLAYINANGTSTGIIWEVLGSLTYDADTYTFYANSTDVNLRLYQDYPVSYVTTSKTVTFSESITKVIYINIESGKTLNNAKIYPMVAKASSISNYEPYTNGASPNPDYPQEVEVVTGLNEVKVEGKNLFDGEIETGSIDSSGTNTTNNNAWRGINYIRVNENTQYTLTFSNLTFSSNAGRISFYDENYNVLSSWPLINSNEYIFTTPTNTKYIRFWCFKTIVPEGTNTQLEKGSTATTYEAYKGQTYEVNLGSIELCKIGTYQDYFYKNNGNWYLHKEIGKVVFDGSESWGRSTTATSGEYRFSILITNCKLGLDIPLKSNYFINTTQTTYSNRGIGGRTDEGGVFINDSSLCTLTLEQFETWASTHNILVYYPLATPTDTQITDTTLVNQLNALYNATIYSTTHINTENSNLLPYIDLKYNVVTASPSPDRASEVEVVKGNNTITISNEDGTKTQTFNITLGNLELCKIGDYQDYFYKDNGNWYKYGAIGKYVYNNDLSNNGETDNRLDFLTPTLNVGANIPNYTLFAYCNLLTYYSNNTGINGTTGSNKIRISISKDYASTHDNARGIFLNKNLTIYYQLTTPTTTQITDQLLVSQLDELQKAMSYYDKTLITQTNASKPFILDVIGIRDLQDIFNLISGE